MLPFLRKTQTLYAWLLVALTDLAVAVPWILLFYRAIIAADWYVAIPGVWLGLVVYAAASLWEAGDRSEHPSPQRRIIAMAVGLTGTYLAAYYLLPVQMRSGLFSANPAWAFMPAAGYLWYQGTLTVAEGLDYSRLFQRYPYQIVGATVGIILLIKFGGAAVPSVAVLLYWSVILLLAGGLISLIVARERMLRAGQASIGEAGSGSERQSRLIAITVIVLLLLTLGASQILSADRMAAITGAVGGAFSAFFHWFGSVIYLILYRWMMIIGPWMERFARWLLLMAAKKKGQEPAEMKDGEPPEDPYKNQPERILDFDKFLVVLKVLLVVALVVLLAYLLVRMGRRRRRQTGTAEEEIIDLGFWSNLWADLKGLLKPGNLVAAATVAAAELLDARDPRMLFRRLQDWGARLGRPRLEHETPNAYRGALEGVQPERAGAVAAVTAVYNQARYGAKGPAPAQVEAAVTAVAALEAEKKTE